MIDLELIPEASRVRVRELIILIEAACSGMTQANTGLYSTWLQELEGLADPDEVHHWLLMLQSRLAVTGNDPTLLIKIEAYQKAPDLVYEGNFDDTQLFSCFELSKQIERLYDIGTQAGILEQGERFDKHTRVTQKQQDVCDYVINWVEKILGLEMQPINVYAPFIWDCQHYKYLREKNLYQIGIRAGLIESFALEEFSESDQETVIAWVRETFSIDLSEPPEPSTVVEPESINIDQPEVFGLSNVDLLEPPELPKLDSPESINLDQRESSELLNLAESEIPSIGKLERQNAVTELLIFAAALLMVLFPIGLVLNGLTQEAAQSQSEWKKLSKEVDAMTQQDVNPTPIPLKSEPQLQKQPSCP